MNQIEFNRRQLMALMGSAAVAAGLPNSALAQDAALKFWAPGIAKVGAKDWSDMAKQSGIEIAAIAKSARADESIQKMVVGDGNALYDAMTDNGGGMEDALASQGAIAELDVSRIPNWANIEPRYLEGGAAADTIRYEGKVVAIPYISNADALAFNHDVIGEELSSWEVLFDEQFKGRAALQNDFGPTLTNTAIYLKQSGKQDIENPSDMTEAEVKGVCQFLIDKKKAGQFRTFWDGFQNGVDLAGLRRGAGVVVLGAHPDRRRSQKQERHPLWHDDRKATRSWNNIVMLTQWRQGARHGRGVLQAGQPLSLAMVWCPHARGPRVHPPDDRRGRVRRCQSSRLRCRLQTRRSRPAWHASRTGSPCPAIPGRTSSRPTSRAYQDWWSRVQAA